MDKEEKIKYLRVLEAINLMYIREAGPYSASAYRRGIIRRLKESFPLHLVGWAFKEAKALKVRKKSGSLSNRDFDSFQVEYSSPEPVEDKKGVVYTCIHGKYDDLKEPLLTSDNLKYVYFTDQQDTYSPDSVWQKQNIREIDVEEGTNWANRFYKMHPFKFFNDADYSIYIDGSVRIVSDVTGLFRCARHAKTGIAMHTHSSYDSLYVESKWCKYNKRGNLERIEKQIERYKKEGFPDSFGHFEATIIVVDLKNPVAKEILDAWWEEFCLTNSGRDQLSLPYVLWKMGYAAEDVGCLGNFVYMNPKFIIEKHIGKLF